MVLIHLRDKPLHMVAEIGSTTNLKYYINTGWGRFGLVLLFWKHRKLTGKKSNCLFVRKTKQKNTCNKIEIRFMASHDVRFLISYRKADGNSTVLFFESCLLSDFWCICDASCGWVFQSKFVLSRTGNNLKFQSPCKSRAPHLSLPFLCEWHKISTNCLVEVKVSHLPQILAYSSRSKHITTWEAPSNQDLLKAQPNLNKPPQYFLG